MNPKHPARRWLILADDLTGAADCATAFAKRGIESKVVWSDGRDGGSSGTESPVLSYDIRCRGASSSVAAAKHRDVLSRHFDSQTNLFKKIDSTLRGQPAAEIAAAMGAVKARAGSAFGVLAPAFPATGRTTLGGRVHIGGEPLETTTIWQSDRTYCSADLVEVLASADIASEKVSLETVRDEGGGLHAALAKIADRNDVVAVCDAATQDDLMRIVAATEPSEDATFFIGSAGLAHALAAALPRTRRETVEIRRTTRGSLIVVGSLAEASKAAARRFAVNADVRYFPVTPDLLLDEAAYIKRAVLAAEIIDALHAGDVLIELVGDEPDRRIGPPLAAELANFLKPAAAQTSGLAATGGETAAALLACFGVEGIRLIDEIESGVSLGLTQGALRLPLVTKSGAFGDEGSLIRIAARLRRIGQLGIVA